MRYTFSLVCSEASTEAEQENDGSHDAEKYYVIFCIFLLVQLLALLDLLGAHSSAIKLLSAALTITFCRLGYTVFELSPVTGRPLTC